MKTTHRNVFESYSEIYTILCEEACVVYHVDTAANHIICSKCWPILLTLARTAK